MKDNIQELLKKLQEEEMSISTKLSEEIDNYHSREGKEPSCIIMTEDFYYALKFYLMENREYLQYQNRQIAEKIAFQEIPIVVVRNQDLKTPFFIFPSPLSR